MDVAAVGVADVDAVWCRGRLPGGNRLRRWDVPHRRRRRARVVVGEVVVVVVGRMDADEGQGSARCLGITRTLLGLGRSRL